MSGNLEWIGSSQGLRGPCVGQRIVLIIYSNSQGIKVLECRLTQRILILFLDSFNQYRVEFLINSTSCFTYYSENPKNITKAILWKHL